MAFQFLLLLLSRRQTSNCILLSNKEVNKNIIVNVNDVIKVEGEFIARKN